MNERLVFLILLCIIGILWRIIAFWRRKTGEAAFAAARMAESDKERDRYCRMAVLAGHRNACRMFCLSRPDLFEDHSPLKPFKLRGIRMAFYGYYYPSRWNDLVGEEQRAFCRSLYRFKEGKIHGIEFFEACMAALQTESKPCHIMFMPCSDKAKYIRRFKRLHGYIGKHHPELTSGLRDVDVFKPRESLHAAKGREKRVLERNYRITGNIEGKEIIIVDDVMTTGQSVADYKKEIEKCGGKVVAAVFYGKTVAVPSLFFVKLYVWSNFYADSINKKTKS